MKICGMLRVRKTVRYRISQSAVLYEALQPDEALRDYVRPYAWLTKLYILYIKKFYPELAMEARTEDAARTLELIRETYRCGGVG